MMSAELLARTIVRGAYKYHCDRASDYGAPANHICDVINTLATGAEDFAAGAPEGAYLHALIEALAPYSSACADFDIYADETAPPGRPANDCEVSDAFKARVDEMCK